MFLTFALENDVLAVGREIALATASPVKGKLAHTREELRFAIGFVRGGEVTAHESKN
ncbi:MAG: hypothetical protein OSB74_01785 [Verrucomicrobiota bacterium]|nr:hypothetical protein [Verrucomicrobiota bacterium]